MASSNPFDQFDAETTGGANPFNKFDAGRPAAQKKEYTKADFYAIPEAAASLASGAFGQVASGIGGIAGAVLPGPEAQGADWQERIAEATTYQPRTKGGEQIAKIAALPGEALAWLGDKVGSGNAKLYAPLTDKIDERIAPALGAASNAVVQAAPALLGLKASTPRRLTVAQQQAEKYRNQGLSMTPTEGAGGIVSKVAEGLSGEAKLAKGISKENIPVIMDKIGEAIGIPKGTPITNESLAGVEKKAWGRYNNVRKSGRIETDAEFTKALDGLDETYKTAAADFPEAAQKLGIKDTEEVITALRKDSFDANSAVDIVRKLREGANKAYMEGNGAHARALRSGATIVEEQIGRHLEATGNTTALKDFREGRTILAKVHDARKALDKNENFNPQKYAEILQKSPNVLTGGALEVAEFARDNPRSAQKAPVGNVNAPTLADVALGLGAGGYHLAGHGLTGGAALPAAAALAARPATRAFLASKAGQATLRPAPNMSPTLERLLASSQANTRRLQDEKK